MFEPRWNKRGAKTPKFPLNLSEDFLQTQLNVNYRTNVAQIGTKTRYRTKIAQSKKTTQIYSL
jgi:phage gpG-like protein